SWAWVASGEFDLGPVTLTAGAMQARNEASGGGPRRTGQVASLNGGVIQWVNPPGFFLTQTPGALAAAGDPRPVPGARIDSEMAPIGPQAQSVLVGGLRSEVFEGHTLELEGAWTTYRSNRQSAYRSRGSAWRAAFRGGYEAWTYEVEAFRVGPRHDPFVLQYPSVDPALFYVYWRFPEQSQQSNLYSLHSTRQYPHNRQGFRGKVEYRLPDSLGELTLAGGRMAQAEPSVFDVRVPSGSLGPNTPIADVAGFSPGWFDAIFMPVAPGTYGPDLTPAEQPRGKVAFVELTPRIVVSEGVLELEGAARVWTFFRNSSLPPPTGSQNRIDLELTQFELAANLGSLSELHGRVELGRHRIAGHMDPVGYYNAFAVASGSTGFETVDTQQWVPRVTLSVPVGQAGQWDLSYAHFFTTDGVEITAAANGGNQFNPFRWTGGQLTSRFQVDF
ncbi:MAG: hypothetical protein AB1758_06365, partial [Candidatus Eremiobacterota bacterium]